MLYEVITRRDDLVFAATQMRNGHGTGFLGVVNKVPLRGVVGLGTDDLDGVLVGTNGTVGTQTIEQGTEDIASLDVVGLVVFEAGEGKVVVGTDTEFFLRSQGGHVVIHSLDHGRGELGGTQTVTAVVV